jgi:hypothetical protein
MKNQVHKLFFGKNAVVSLLIVSIAMLFVVLGCSGSKKDAKPVPSEYYGAWTGSDGSTLTIRSDSSGDYHSGGTKVDNGTVAIDDSAKTLSISFFGIGPSLKIDQAPSGNQMKLDGIVYKKSGSSDSKENVKSDTSKSSEKSDGETPSDSEVESLLKDTMSDFADGVEDEDFSTFRRNSSADFQATYTATELKGTFQSFISQKDKLMPSLHDVQNESASFSSSPSVRTEKGYKILTADGEFPTSPNTTKFETEYELEKGTWKLFKFKIRL